jgi:hypothetical protein
MIIEGVFNGGISDLYGWRCRFFTVRIGIAKEKRDVV